MISESHLRHRSQQEVLDGPIHDVRIGDRPHVPHVLVLSCDEKRQNQALNRTQPGLPMMRGRAGTVTHDYKRHGRTTLFAALNTLDCS